MRIGRKPPRRTVYDVGLATPDPTLARDMDIAAEEVRGTNERLKNLVGDLRREAAKVRRATNGTAAPG